MSDCFSYFGLGRLETHAQQNEARMELSWRRVGIGNQAKGTESEDLDWSQSWAS